MTSPRKVEANRRNALKSTGPKTAAGKARASRNNLRHGVLSFAPVVREMERPEDWTSHLAGVRASLAPVGYLEETLTDRLALLLWRMTRVARFEVEMLAVGVETAERAVNEARLHDTSDSPDMARTKRNRGDAALRLLGRLESLPPGETPDLVEVDAVLHYLTEITEPHRKPEEDGPLPIPGVPEDEDERADFDGWTAGLLLAAVEAHAAACHHGMTEMVERTAEWAKWEKDHAEAALVHHQKAVGRKKMERLLLEPDAADRVLRYETAAERAFLRTLHELQRLQAARSGGSVLAPVAVDVAVSTSGDGGMEA